MTEMYAAIVILGFALFLGLLLILSDGFVSWWEFRRHVNQAIALTKDKP